MMERLQELAVSIVMSNPLVERLAAASIDLIVVTVLVAVIVALARIRSRRVVALLWLVALIKPVVSLAVGAPAPLIPIATPVADADGLAIGTGHNVELMVSHVDGNSVVCEETTEIAPAMGPAGGVTDRAGTAGTTAAAAWVLGVLAMAALSLRDRWRLRRVIAASHAAGPEVTDRAERIAASLRSGRAPRVLVTPGLESPALAGTLRPVILIPSWLTGPDHGERLEWALRHELAHWASRDHLANLASEVARALFFFHPLVWWTARRWKESMEMACDQAVVSNPREIKCYAEQLYLILARVDERRRLAPAASLFATRTQIGRRIETLLRSRRPVARPGAAAIAVVVVFATASLAVGADFSRPKPPKAPRPPVVVESGSVMAVAPTPATPRTPGTPSVVMVQGSEPLLGTAHYDNVNLFETSDDRELRLRGEGIEFERFTGRIVNIDDDGFLRVWETTGDGERHVYISTGDDGDLRFNYRVDGERADWDADARDWLAGVLRSHLTRVRNPNQNANQFVVAPRPPVGGPPIRVRALEPLPELPAVPAVPAPPSVEPAPEIRYKAHKRNH
jgi:beta-lactamase regulating signal transducer with metallopeptidase domain